MTMQRLVPLCLAFISLALGVESKTTFENPAPAGAYLDYADNPRFRVGQRVEVRWSSTLENMTLFLCRQEPGEPNKYALMKNLNHSDYTWLISPLSKDVPKDEDGIYYLEVHGAGASEADGTSHYFNITQSPTKPSSTSSSPTTATPTGQPADRTQTNPAAGSGSGLSKGTIAGIAVGSTLGGLLLLVGAALLVWRRPWTSSQRVESTNNASELAGEGSMGGKLISDPSIQGELYGEPDLAPGSDAAAFPPVSRPSAHGSRGLHEMA